MTITLKPMLAMFNLGGGEIILILFVLMFMAFAATVVGIVAFLVIRARGKQPIPTVPPAGSPPVAESTQVIRKCPKCGADLKADAPEGLCPACLLQRGIATEGGAPPGTPPFTPPPLAELAKLFPQLEILEVIGQGGMGAVYKARQPSLDRFVALKILAPRTGGDLDFSGRFTREARALARLSHPNIVGVYDFGQIQRSAVIPAGAQPSTPDTQPLSYFIMEYVDGPNLRQVEQAGKLTSREALQIIPQICAALQFAHDEGIVHRDIKPENVLLDKKGRVKIADFGLAKILGQEADFRLTGARDVMGTPHYMAPEQVEKPQEVDHRADIYSLGVVFYEMLTGELPIGKFDPPSHKVQIDVRLDDVVLRSLANNPDRRYQHVSEVGTQVEAIAQTASAAGAQTSTSAFTVPADYQLGIGHCIARGWNLVKQNFWPAVGVNALVVILLAFMGSFSLTLSPHLPGTQITFVLSAIFGGPLLGGLYLYFLKLIRGERPAVGTVFSGFSNRFLHLFLGSLVGSVLVVIGLFCLILPGIYLSTAWLFTLILIIDKGLGFWPAMELSRKIITKHWWKFFGFAMVLFLLKLVGILFCLVGFFIAGPVVHAAFLYAYEDIIGSTAAATKASRVAGDAVKPAPAGNGRPSRLLLALGLAAAAAIVIGLVAFSVAVHNHLRHHRSIHLSSRAKGISETSLPLEANTAARNSAAPPIFTDADLVAPKEIVLVRPTNQLINATDDLRTVSVWTDTYLQPGEILMGMVKRGDAELRDAGNSLTFVRCEAGRVGMSSVCNWYFGGAMAAGFGNDEAEAAVAQLSDTGGPIALVPGKPQQVFSVTNNTGEIMSGYLEFNRVLPAPATPGTKIEATVQITGVRGYSPNSPGVDYSATIPPGYALRATANIGSVNTTHPAGPSEYRSDWMNLPQPPLRPLRMQPGQRVSPMPQPPRLKSPEEYLASHRALELQLQTLKDQGDISVALGAPKLLFSITNDGGEVLEGFLELVGPQKVQPANDPASILLEQPPVVVGTFPASGATNVPPGETEIRVRFSKGMENSSWSWSSAWENSTPETAGEPHYLNDNRTCVLKVQLEPDRTYAWWLNSENFHNFKDQAGRPAVPYLLIFHTKPN